MEAPMVSTSLPARMRASLLGYWRQARPAQRFGYLVGGARILAGLAHLLAWLLVGGAWAGPVSFRKPTTFGVSFGLTHHPGLGGRPAADRRPRPLAAAWPLAAADTHEVAWVSTQRWRGVASHFNEATTLDYRLFLAGAAAIAVTVTVIVALTVLAFTVMRAPPSMAFAIRAGLLVQTATVGYLALVAVSLLQTASGLAPLDVGVAAAVLSLLGVLLLGVAFAAALLPSAPPHRRQPRRPRSCR